MHGHHASIVRASILYVQQRHNNAVIIHQLLPAIPSFHPFLSFSSIPSAQSHNLMTISPSHPSSCPIPYIVHHWLPSSHLVQSHPSFMIAHRPVLLITVIHPSSHPVQSHHLPSSIILSSAISSFYPTPSIILSSPIPIIIHPWSYPVPSIPSLIAIGRIMCGRPCRLYRAHISYYIQNQRRNTFSLMYPWKGE